MFAFFLILFIGECGQDGFAYREVESNHWQPGTETGNNTNTPTHTRCLDLSTYTYNQIINIQNYSVQTAVFLY